MVRQCSVYHRMRSVYNRMSNVCITYVSVWVTYASIWIGVTYALRVNIQLWITQTFQFGKSQYLHFQTRPRGVKMPAKMSSAHFSHFPSLLSSISFNRIKCHFNQNGVGEEFLSTTDEKWRKLTLYMHVFWA